MQGEAVPADGHTIYQAIRDNFARIEVLRKEVEYAVSTVRLRDELERKRNELRVLLEHVPADHSTVAPAELDVGFALFKIGRYSEALEHLQTALRIYRASRGGYVDGSLEVADAEQKVGITLRALGRHSEAFAHIFTAMRIYKANLSKDDFHVTEARRDVVANIDELGTLTSLSEIDLSGCEDLTHLPESIGNLTKMRRLNLEGCKRLRSLPYTVAHLEGECTVRVDGCGIVSTYTLKPDGDGRCSMADIQAACRQDQTVQSLLGDRDARNQALNYLAVVAVLLATAASVAFSQTPMSADQWEGREDVAVNIGWLRHYFKADQVAFYVATVVVLFVLVSSMPQSAYTDRNIQAGRVWLVYAFLSLMLFTAVTCGMFAFVASAVAVYPHALLPTDVMGPGVVACVLASVAALNWCTSVARLFPGFRSVGKYLCAALYLDKVCWCCQPRAGRGEKPRDKTPPRPGLDELMAEVVSVQKEQKKLSEKNVEALEALKKQNDEVIALLRKMSEAPIEGRA